MFTHLGIKLGQLTPDDRATRLERVNPGQVLDQLVMKGMSTSRQLPDHRGAVRRQARRGAGRGGRVRFTQLVLRGAGGRPPGASGWCWCGHWIGFSNRDKGWEQANGPNQKRAARRHQAGLLAPVKSGFTARTPRFAPRTWRCRSRPARDGRSHRGRPPPSSTRPCPASDFP